MCVCVPVAAASAEDGAPPPPVRNPAGVSAQTDGAPPLPERNPLRSAKPVAAPVKPPPPPLPGEQPTVPWTQQEIEAAKAVCKELLTGDPLDYEELSPIKEGLCGTPAPVLLRAVGTDHKVTINPPATMSCPMADVLGDWLHDTVQPEAKKLFGSPVVKIQNSSSYVCRNRYGGSGTPLSEHALANAFDVSEFVLADGTRISILSDWPKAVEPAPPAPEANPKRVTEAKDTGGAPKPKPEKAKGDAAKSGAVTAEKAESDVQPSPPPDAKEADPGPKARFVKFLYEDACRRFGTVLGPEANAAHKDHFHLDMKKRRRAFCE
jgi:hypothetical protein